MRILKDFLDRHPGPALLPTGKQEGAAFAVHVGPPGNGDTVEDEVTGFRGVVTGVVFYLSGCHQALVVPRANEKGELPPSEWFDLQRLRVDTSVPRILLDNGATPGFDRAPPKR